MSTDKTFSICTSNGSNRVCCICNKHILAGVPMFVVHESVVSHKSTRLREVEVMHMGECSTTYSKASERAKKKAKLKSKREKE